MMARRKLDAAAGAPPPPPPAVSSRAVILGDDGAQEIRRRGRRRAPRCRVAGDRRLLAHRHMWTCLFMNNGHGRTILTARITRVIVAVTRQVPWYRGNPRQCTLS